MEIEHPIDSNLAEFSLLGQPFVEDQTSSHLPLFTST